MIDPRLSERFAVIRNATTPHTVLDADELAVIAKLTSRAGAQRFGLIAAQATKVALSQSIHALMVPGENGVFILIRGTGGGFFGFGAKTETVLAGEPIGSSGMTLFGMAPDGITDQPVELSDGMTIQARVVNNLYVVDDPSRTHPDPRTPD